ncbi:hypothetical protein KDA23_04635 [Candidatus Saccharibacteria bacterium]|nr:hypothetical protein [Candidatus Saccharibacteria bacterium]
MSETTQNLPFQTEYLSEWCENRGIDRYDFTQLWCQNFLVAGSHLTALTVAQKTRIELEASLPLEDCTRVLDPRILPGEHFRPRHVYRAPDGLGFRLQTKEEYPVEDEWGEVKPDAPVEVVERDFVGKYLDLDVRGSHGEGNGVITVFKKPTYFAVPDVNMGGNLFGPTEEDMIRLPSKYDPEKDGAYVAFGRQEGWDIFIDTEKQRGNVHESDVSIVLFEEQADTELYVADFSELAHFDLDDFLYIEEPVKIPGYAYIPQCYAHGWEWELFPTLSELLLPPLDQDYWGPLWYEHEIMIKFHPMASKDRFIRLDFAQPLRADFEVRWLNRQQQENGSFNRLFAVQDMGGLSLREVVLAVSTRHFATDAEIKEFTGPGPKF